MIKNTENSYGVISRILHWVMAIIIVLLLACGFYMSDLPASDQKWLLYNAHKATGVVALALIMVRICNRFFSTTPKLPKDVPTWQAKVAYINVMLLYILMLLMPLSGFVGSLTSGYNISFFGLFTIPSVGKLDISRVLWEIHETCPPIFVFLITVHVLASIYHHFVLKDKVLIRMIRGS